MVSAASAHMDAAPAASKVEELTKSPHSGKEDRGEGQAVKADKSAGYYGPAKMNGEEVREGRTIPIGKGLVAGSG